MLRLEEEKVEDSVEETDEVAEDTVDGEDTEE